MDDAVREALAEVVAALPGGATRAGQEAMAGAVAQAIAQRRHLVVQAGTGTGKTLAYLVPAVLSGRRTVVATATRALQDQLAVKDLPLLTGHLDRPFTYAVLKGRSNYLCRQRLDEALAGEIQLSLGATAEPAHRPSPTEIAELAVWAEETPTGDRADLRREPRPATWAAVSTGADECPGATRCPRGEDCFAEQARAAAAQADVIVVNAHLYGTHLAAGGTVLPDHDLVVFDEAHQLEDVVSATCGVELSGGRFAGVARLVAGAVADDALRDDLARWGERLTATLEPDAGRRLRHLPDELALLLASARARVDDALGALRATDAGDDTVKAKRERAGRAARGLLGDVDAALDLAPDEVAWIEGGEAAVGSARLRIAPLDVGPLLAEGVWSERPAVLTSATIPPGLPDRLGLPATQVDELDAGSPFDFESAALLYCAAHLPEPRAEGYEAALHEELTALIGAAGGRTLGLFTSHRAMRAAADAVSPALPGPLLVQGDLPKPALIAAFADDEATSLFATVSYWQGVDVPGRSLSLVTVDRLPFPRPDEPLLQARREQARAAAFATVDLPRAATLLAQGAGRLVRTARDRGVVAVLDSRLATASYRWDIVAALPPMRRTRHRAEVVQFLRTITG